MPEGRSLIRKRAIAGLILYSAPTWLPNGGFLSRDEGFVAQNSAGYGQPRTAHSSMVSIEVDLFSGRPNPVAKLRGEHAATLIDLIRRRRVRLSNHRTKASDLGFRGFVVLIDHTAYRINGSVLSVAGRDYYDPGRPTEEFIISVLPSELRALVQPLIRDGEFSQ